MKPDTLLPLHDNDPNDFVMVSSGSSARVTDNFTEGELYNPKIGRSHPISLQAVRCVQIVRDAFDYPIRITSTYRTYVPPGGVSQSPHMMACAIDFQFVGAQAEVDRLFVSVREDYKAKGPLFRALWDAGARGFGVYDTFLHIDTVQSELYPSFRSKRTDTWRGARYAYWNNQKRLRYNTDTVSANIAQQSGISFDWLFRPFGALVGMFREIISPDDRGTDIKGRSLAWALVAVLLFGLAFYYFRKKLPTWKNVF